MQADLLDPQIRAFQRAISDAYGRYPGFDDRTIAERRRIAEEVRAPWAKGGPEMARRTELVSPEGVRLRIHMPSEAPGLPGLVYLHGGGWMLFSLDSHDRLMREYAARAGVAVIGIDYPLSPEHRFPTAIDQIASVVEWLREAGPELGIDARRLAIGGDSVGANMAVAASLLIRGRGSAPLAAMLLNYGAFDTEESQSFAQFGGPEFMLNGDEMRVFWANYLRSEADLSDPLARPAIAELGGLPPAYFCIAGADILRDQNLALANRMREAGVEVEAVVHEGATHSFLEAVSIAPIADRALAEASAWLAGRLGSKAR